MCARCLQAEKGGASWRSLIETSGGLKFEKSIEEKRAEISRDDNYKVLDPLARDGKPGQDSASGSKAEEPVESKPTKQSKNMPNF